MMPLRQICAVALVALVSACSVAGTATGPGLAGQSEPSAQAGQAAPTGAFRARFGFTVVPTAPNTFDIIPRRTTMKEAYWCAAGDYARRALGLDWKTRLWVVEGYHKSTTSGATSLATFTTDPAAHGLSAPQGAAALDMLAVGSNESVTGAFGRCRDVELEVFGF
ncbi:MAG: hypothetical protein OIF47_08260 [Marinibacterium sp.]|nr:hypothetical protein [Marinibacterium sp.]